MIKGYYLFPTYIKEGEPLIFTGVMNKMDMQVKELSKWFHTEFKVIYAPSCWTKFQHKVLNRVFVFYSQKREYDKAVSEMDSPNFIYIRKVEADKEYIDFLRKMRTKFPSSKIIVEIPTYPYERDAYKRLTSKINLIKDRVYRKKYKEYIDRFVTFTSDEFIFDVPTIRTMNGINVDSQKLIGEKPKDYQNAINLIFVGMMQRQHGLERVIRGIKEYYRNNPSTIVRCLFVGHGPEYEPYKSMTKQIGVEKYIKFCGKKSGNELDEVYDCADIAIAPLGCYKTLAPETRSSALKTREYLARGLPIITGCIEDVFEQFPCEYHIDFENNDSNINIQHVVNWYQQLMDKNASRLELASTIRNYAYLHVDNASTMKPIIDYISGVEKKKQEDLK